MINSLIILLIIFIMLILLSLFWKRQVNRWLDIKDKEQKNKKFALFNDVNVDTVNKVLNDYIDGYVNRYIVYKFMSQKIIYIRKEDIDQMIKDITKNIMLEVSELYLYYISLVYSYSNDEELATYIHNKVTVATIDTVANYNNTNISEG